MPKTTRTRVGHLTGHETDKLPLVNCLELMHLCHIISIFTFLFRFTSLLNLFVIIVTKIAIAGKTKLVIHISMFLLALKGNDDLKPL